MKLISENELAHIGVLGMKWGKGGSRAPGVGFGKKRQAAYNQKQLATNKRDLDTLDRGGHLRVGFGKSRQAAYDKRDRAAIEKSNAKLKEPKFKNINPPKQIALNLLGATAGAIGAHSILSLTDARLSKTSMYVGTIIGGAAGARLMNTIHVAD